MPFTHHECPECGGPSVALTSVDMLLCADCKIYWDWKLAVGQKSVLIHGKVGEGDGKQDYQSQGDD